MNEETKQILRNQKIIMKVLRWSEGALNISEIYLNSLSNQTKKTEELLNPKEEQSLADKTEDSLRGDQE